MFPVAVYLKMVYYIFDVFSGGKIQTFVKLVLHVIIKVTTDFHIR